MLATTMTIPTFASFQLVAEVPQTVGDVAVAWIVTDGRSLAAT